ncbi:MAG TPA: hypothetical protein VGJ60_33940 [Chloroflexota bacterium]|jgi:hypothetical protein
MSLANGARFLDWVSRRFDDDAEPARCLRHPDESAPALLELLDGAAPLLLVGHALSTSEGGADGLTPTALVDLTNRPDLLDLVRVARLESAGRSAHEYTWHAVRRGFANFAVVQLRIHCPARAELSIAFPTRIPQIRQLLEAAAATGWMTISDATGEVTLLMADVGVGLAECLGAEEAD